MIQFSFPTQIILGEGALKAGAESIKKRSVKKVLVVSDETLTRLGLVEKVLTTLTAAGIPCELFDKTSPNPTEENVEKGVEAYKKSDCDSLIALGGGSPMDAAKVIGLAATHPAPLAQYDDALGGDQRIDGGKLPPIFAIPTTAGTGSEVGRSGVIVMRESGDKTIFFHPKLLPSLAILEPTLLKDLPPSITAATGVDAFTHCLEAYFAPGFHPMADGIALEGIRLVLTHLRTSVEDGKNLQAREKMLIAASMGATAFQKGLGMIHSLAHPLSSLCGIHHGLANALLLPHAVRFLESSKLTEEQKQRLEAIRLLFLEKGYSSEFLSTACENWLKELRIEPGLKNHGVLESQIPLLSRKAFADPCHKSNMIEVTPKILETTYREAFE